MGALRKWLRVLAIFSSSICRICSVLAHTLRVYELGVLKFIQTDGLLRLSPPRSPYNVGMCSRMDTDAVCLLVSVFLHSHDHFADNMKKIVQRGTSHFNRTALVFHADPIASLKFSTRNVRRNSSGIVNGMADADVGNACRHTEMWLYKCKYI